MVILGALAAALGWGVSDYSGGYVAQRDAPVFAIVAVSELLGLVLLLPALLARGAPLPTSPRMLLAVAAGLSTTLELGLVYRALSRGSAFVTAPVGALGAATAVAIGVIGGDPLGAVITIGLVCALLGSAISTRTTPNAAASCPSMLGRDTAVRLAAALSVGATLTLLHAAGRLDPYWVTATEHASTAVVAGLVAAVFAARSPRADAGSSAQALLARRRLATIVLIAVAGTCGDVAYITASHRGVLSIVSAIASLYPITTIALGRVLRGHRATRVQLTGVAVALTGAVLLGAAAH
ncbi:MAG TPA: EamA family transporter [Solirubrobacteraceae bacterium]|jgi:drug/metabolite transporter (DMT)-like permease|nr:EamA family transporter [Solirubrobacteraceae bacterium]